MAANTADPNAMQKWIEEANNPPKHPEKALLPEPKTQRGGKEGLKRGGKEVEGGGNNAEQFTKLSPDVQAQFPDADLSQVTVILNSQDAADQGVEGFYKDGVIHIAPGVDRAKVERHEAAHAAMAGGNNTKEGQQPGQPQPVSDSERQAQQAEGGQTMTAADLGNADPSRQMNSEPSPTNVNNSGFPSISWNGLTFDKISGSFNEEILSTDWNSVSLVRPPTVRWPIPCFPGGFLTVSGGVDLAPSANVTANIGYSWNGSAFEVTGALQATLGCSLTGWVEGGAELNAIIQRGGVGLRAGLTLGVSAQVSRQVAFSIGQDGASFTDTPLAFNISGDLKGAITARAWTEGWIWNTIHEWQLAEMTLATLTGAQAQVSLTANSNGALRASLGTVAPGTFAWGGAPPITEQNGVEI